MGSIDGDGSNMEEVQSRAIIIGQTVVYFPKDIGSDYFKPVDVPDNCLLKQWDKAQLRATSNGWIK